MPRPAARRGARRCGSSCPAASRAAAVFALAVAASWRRGPAAGAFTSPRLDGQQARAPCQDGGPPSLCGRRPQHVRAAELAAGPWTAPDPPVRTPCRNGVQYARLQTELPLLEGRDLRPRPWPEALGAPALALLAAAGALAGLLAVLAHGWALGGHLHVPRAAKFFVAGGVGASLSHALATPLDVIKTRQQAAPELYRTAEGKPLGVAGTGARIVLDEGPHMLLQGLGATFSGYLLQGAFKFGLWEALKGVLGYGLAEGAHKVGVLVLAAFGADMVASLLLCPFERARIRMVSDGQFAQDTLGAVRRMVREEGLLTGLYGGGLAATMLKQQTYTIAKFTSFTLVSEALCGLASTAPRALLTLAGSATAGLMASLASQPGDALQVRLSAGGAHGGLLSTARDVGLKNLFTGWKARLVQVEVIVVSQLFLYDYMKTLVGL